MIIKMHPVTYAQVWKWTGKELDGVELYKTNETGVAGSMVLGGKKRQLKVDTGFPKDDIVNIECSIGELRSLISMGLREEQNTSGGKE